MKNLLLILIFSVVSVYAEDINLHGLDEEHTHLSQRVQLSQNLTVDFHIDLSERGIGFMKILNLNLPVVDGDQNHGGIHLEHGMMNVALSDLNKDGFKDLIVYGTVIYMDFHSKWEKELGRESVLFIYSYIPKLKKFKETFRRASHNLEKGVSVHMQKELEACRNREELNKIIHRERQKAEDLFKD